MKEKETEGKDKKKDEGLSLIVSVFFKYLLYALKRG